MKFVVAGQTALGRLANVVDNHFGYPKPGVDIGDGLHVPPAQSITATHANVVQNFTTATKFGYPLHVAAYETLYLNIRAACQAAVAAGTATPLQTAVASLPDPVADDGTWFPTVTP